LTSTVSPRTRKQSLSIPGNLGVAPVRSLPQGLKVKCACKRPRSRTVVSWLPFCLSLPGSYLIFGCHSGDPVLQVPWRFQTPSVGPTAPINQRVGPKDLIVRQITELFLWRDLQEF
jgi:hypothetical protein